MKYIIKISILSLLYFSFSVKMVAQIPNQYDNSTHIEYVKYKSEANSETVVSIISYNDNGDTLLWENPSEKLKMVRYYYENGQIMREENPKHRKY